MSDTLADLMLRNLSEVFGERDSGRRMAAIKNLYSEDAVFFEAEQRFEGHQTIGDAARHASAWSPTNSASLVVTRRPVSLSRTRGPNP
jgi:ketosteroid isomerase-like protein